MQGRIYLETCVQRTIVTVCIRSLMKIENSERRLQISMPESECLSLSIVGNAN